MTLLRTPPRVLRAVGIAAVVAQAGIAVTGSVVRVTGSGLGCPTWPQCFPGSFVPDPHADVATLHQWVEFGNRLFNVAIGVVALGCLLAALLTRPRRRRLTVLAAAMPAGVLVQAVLGGVTVLAGLVWWTVALHFLASMVLVWLAVLLVQATRDGAGPPRLVVPAPVRGLLVAGTLLLAALLTAGTLVTAAGPHAGDARTARLGLSVGALAQLHADLLFGYLGLLLGLGFALRAVAAPRVLRCRYAVLVGVVLAQGALGGVQYAIGIPEVLVSLHVLGACLVTIATAAVWTGTVEREPAPRLVRAAAAPAVPVAAR